MWRDAGCDDQAASAHSGPRRARRRLSRRAIPHRALWILREMRADERREAAQRTFAGRAPRGGNITCWRAAQLLTNACELVLDFFLRANGFVEVVTSAPLYPVIDAELAG